MLTKSLLPTTTGTLVPVEQYEALELASTVFMTAGELGIHAHACGEPMECQESLEAALYDLRPSAQDTATLYHLATALVDILSRITPKEED